MTNNFQDIELLKYYFSPKIITGNSLPKISTVTDNIFFILISGKTKSLYLANGGLWNLVGTLNQIQQVSPSATQSSTSPSTSLTGVIVYEYNFTYSSQNGATIYQISNNEVLLQSTIIVKTVFNGTAPTLGILDTLGNTVFDSSYNSLKNAGVYVNPQQVNSKYSTSANIYLSLNIDSSTQGSGTIYLTTQKF